MTEPDQQRSQRPYLVRALYEWVLDCGYTPYLLVAAGEEGVEVPREYVGGDGRIVLNLNPSAVQGLELGNELISFSARFGGVAQQVFVPTSAVLAIYAKETGAGMLFGEPEASVGMELKAGDSTTQSDHEGPDDPDPEDTPTDPSGRRRGHLRIVK